MTFYELIEAVPTKTLTKPQSSTHCLFVHALSSIEFVSNPISSRPVLNGSVSLTRTYAHHLYTDSEPKIVRTKLSKRAHNPHVCVLGLAASRSPSL